MSRVFLKRGVHMINDNIILIGMSGAGKSTLGVLLAKAIGKSFVDTDIIIQQKEERLLQEIIDCFGIERFMEIEEETVSSENFENSVVATGGSVVYSEKIMNSLKEKGKIVYLYVPYEELAARVKNISTRGIVMRSGSTYEDVYNERLPLYEKYADITVDCSSMDIERCVEKIVSQLNK